MIRNLKSVIVWHDAKECLPAKDGKYWVIPNVDIDNLANTMDMSYSVKYGFNTTVDDYEHGFEVLYWTEKPHIKAIDPEHEEDW